MAALAGVLAVLPQAWSSSATPAGARLHVLATVRTGGGPTWLASAAGSLWVANCHSGGLERIDPRRNRVAARLDPGLVPYAVAYGAGSLWLSSYDRPTVARIDPASRRVVARIDVGGAQQAGISASTAAVWVALYGEGLVVRIAPASNAVVARIHVGGNPEDVVPSAGAIWVPNENGTLARIDPNTNTVAASIRVGRDPDNAIACAGRIWTTNLVGPNLLAIDPAKDRVVARLRMPAGSVGLACGRSLWSANYNTGVVLRIDPRRRRITGRTSVGRQPRALALLAGSVWVANQASGTVTRIRGANPEAARGDLASAGDRSLSLSRCASAPSLSV